MSLFGRQGENQRLLDVEEQCAKLRRDFANLEAEWSNAYDKLRRMMMRVSKRAEVVEKSDDADQAPSNGAATPSDGSDGPATGRLSERQRQIQQQILRRRAGGT